MNTKQGSPSDEKWGETGGDSPPTKEKLQKSPPISPPLNFKEFQTTIFEKVIFMTSDTV